jgi:hypothetical protein
MPVPEADDSSTRERWGTYAPPRRGSVLVVDASALFPTPIVTKDEAGHADVPSPLLVSVTRYRPAGTRSPSSSNPRQEAEIGFLGEAVPVMRRTTACPHKGRTVSVHPCLWLTRDRTLTSTGSPTLTVRGVMRGSIKLDPMRRAV